MDNIRYNNRVRNNNIYNRASKPTHLTSDISSHLLHIIIWFKRFLVICQKTIALIQRISKTLELEKTAEP